MLQMQAGKELVHRTHRVARRLFAQHLAGARLEVNPLAHQRNAITAGAVNTDVAVGIAQVLDHQQTNLAGHVALGPDTLGLGNHGIDRRQLSRHARLVMRQAGVLGLDDLVAVMQRLEQGAGYREVIERGKDHQTGKGKEEVERQRHHTGHVVQIECTALGALVRPEGKEFLEDLAVHDHPGDQRYQHDQGRQTDNKGTDVLPVQLQAVMHRVEPVAADFQLIIGQRRTGTRVDGCPTVYVQVIVFGVDWLIGDIKLGADAQHRVTVGGVGKQADHGHGLRRREITNDPLGGRGHIQRVGLEIGKDLFKQVVVGRHRLRLEARIRNRPTVNLAVKHRERAKKEGDHQDKAQHQPEPGMHPGHGLTKTVQHGGAPIR